MLPSKGCTTQGLRPAMRRRQHTTLQTPSHPFLEGWECLSGGAFSRESSQGCRHPWHTKSLVPFCLASCKMHLWGADEGFFGRGSNSCLMVICISTFPPVPAHPPLHASPSRRRCCCSCSCFCSCSLLHFVIVLYPLHLLHLYLLALYCCLPSLLPVIDVNAKLELVLQSRNLCTIPTSTPTLLITTLH